MGLRSALPHVFWLHIYIVCVCASGSNSNLVAMASVVQQAVSSCPGRNIVFCSSGGFGACVPSPSSHASPLSPMCARDPLFCVTHTAFSFYRVSRAKSRIGLRNRFAVLFNRTRFTLSCLPAVTSVRACVRRRWLCWRGCAVWCGIWCEPGCICERLCASTVHHVLLRHL